MSGYGGDLPTRRRVLASLGTGTAAGLAGCFGDANGDGGEGGDDTGDGTDEADEDHQYATNLAHPGDEPIEFEGLRCPVCNMQPADYPSWQSQLGHEDGTGAAFDTPGCLFAYYAAPPTESPVEGAWVTDFETGDLIDATAAHYVIVTDENAVTGEVMGLNPRPFADREDAVAYLEEWDAESLTEDDIIGLADVDRDVAAIYRGNRLPDE
ncbi:nitrous oxide reductase accessory protein NosL [Natrarchaeobius sp. A-rgal3]|uniref:nitrous oxide reductase accessory protein NosL n=1 Tax=Natrarchaeobius versutus TaxID=1679078 RepID=UPI0035102590